MAGILCIQTNPIVGNKTLNLEKIEYYIEENSDKKLDLVVLPEFFPTGISDKHFKDFPENDKGGQTIEFIKKLAVKYKTNIVAGTVIEKVDEKYYNTSFAINRAGEIVGKYRKIHLYNFMGGNEGSLITAGEKEIVIDFDFGKVGLAICYDIRYPLHFKKLVQMGAQLIVCPTAWVIPNEVYDNNEMLKYAQDMWISMIRTRAYDNMVYFAVCNQTQKANNNQSTIGTSLIISPTAEILANAGNSESAIYSDIELRTVDFLKSVYPISSID